MKAYSMIKKRWLFILGLMFMVLPFSVNALEEEPRYEASLKFYRIGEEWLDEDNYLGLEEWKLNVYWNNLEEELTESSEINPGDYIAIAPVVKLIDGKEANAIDFNLYIKYDANIFDVWDWETNLNSNVRKGPFIKNGRWKGNVNYLTQHFGPKLIFEFSGFTQEQYRTFYSNKNDYPIGFVLLKVKDTVEAGKITTFEFINENYNNTSVGIVDENNVIIEQPIITNNYMLTVGGGVMKSETVREPNNVMASTKIDKIKVYDINRNDEEDYVIGIDPYTTLNELKQSFPNYNDYLKVYDRNGNAVTDPNALIGTEMTLKLEKDGSVLDALKIVVRGDLNFDGKVNKSDGVMLDGYIVKILSFNKYQTLAADITKDGKVNGMDQLSLDNYFVGRLKNLN